MTPAFRPRWAGSRLEDVRFPFSRRHRAEPSYGITTADTSHLDDIAKRQRQYVFTMLFRVVAILVVVLVPGLTLLERAILGLVATVIPYVAVVRANGGPDQSEAPTNLMIGPPRQPELPAPGRVLTGVYRIDAEDDFDEGDEGYRADGRAEHDKYGADARDAPDAPDERFVEHETFVRNEPPAASRVYEPPPAPSAAPPPAPSRPSRKRTDAYGSTASSVSTASPAPAPKKSAPNANSVETG